MAADLQVNLLGCIWKPDSFGLEVRLLRELPHGEVEFGVYKLSQTQPLFTFGGCELLYAWFLQLCEDELLRGIQQNKNTSRHNVWVPDPDDSTYDCGMHSFLPLLARSPAAPPPPAPSPLSSHVYRILDRLSDGKPIGMKVTVHLRGREHTHDDKVVILSHPMPEEMQKPTYTYVKCLALKKQIAAVNGGPYHFDFRYKYFHPMGQPGARESHHEGLLAVYTFLHEEQYYAQVHGTMKQTATQQQKDEFNRIRFREFAEVQPFCSFYDPSDCDFVYPAGRLYEQWVRRMESLWTQALVAHTCIAGLHAQGQEKNRG